MLLETAHFFIHYIKMLPSLYYSKILLRYFSGSGPASLSWDVRTYKCAQIYLQKLRPSVENEHSFLQRHEQKEKEPLFFLTAKGNPLPSSQICGRITKVAQMLDPSISGKVTGKRIRKSTASKRRTCAPNVTFDIHCRRTLRHEGHNQRCDIYIHYYDLFQNFSPIVKHRDEI